MNRIILKADEAFGAFRRLYCLIQKKMRNKVFLITYLTTLVSAIFFFLLFSFKLERPFTIPIKDFVFKNSIKLSLIDSIRVDNLNKEAFDLRLTNPSKTIVLGDSALNLAHKTDYTTGIGEALRVKGIGYFYLDNNEKAIENYIKALKEFHKCKNRIKEARVYNNIGRLYRTIDYKKALYYYEKSLNTSKGLGDKELDAGVYFNMACIFQANSNFKKALYYYGRSNKIFSTQKDSVNMLINLLYTGSTYHQLKNYKEAESKLKLAIEGSEKRKMYPILMDAYTCLAKINLDQGKYLEAEKNIKEGLIHSKAHDNKRFEYDLIYSAYQLEVNRKNYDKALHYLIQIHKYDSLQLSIHQSKNIGKTSQNQIQEEKIQENELIIAEQKYRENFYWLTFIIIFLLVLLSILIGIGTYFILKKIRRRKDIHIENKVTTLEQKTLQSMMNPHFIFNVLNTIQYFINQEDSKEANRILVSFSRLMRKHLEICLQSSITLAEEIEYLSLYLSLEKIRFYEKMGYKIKVQKNINTEELVLPPMLIQPFIENAIWHGLIPKESKGVLILDISCKQGELIIKVTDNGVGISNSIKNKANNHISRGIELIDERIKLLNKINKNNITISKRQIGKKGTEVLITIPL